MASTLFKLASGLALLVATTLVLAQDIQERTIAVLIRLFEDVIEVADGLMVVQNEDETDWLRHACSEAVTELPV